MKLALSGCTMSLSAEDIKILKVTPTTNMSVARQMLQVINWAYRGKPDVPSWTGIRLLLIFHIRSDLCRTGLLLT